MKQNNYLLLSSSFFLIEKKIAEIIEKRNFLDATITYYDLEEDSLDRVLEDVDTISFLTPKKVVVAKNALFLESGTKENEKILSHLLKYLDHPDENVLLIFTVTKLDERKKIVKEIKKKIEFFNLTPDIRSYIKSLFKDYRFDENVLFLLLSYVGEDYDKLFMESEKLKNYCFDQKEITKEDIMKLVDEKIGDEDQLAFSLSRNILEKNKKRAFQDLKELEHYQIKPHAIIGLIESQYRLLYQVKLLENRNMKKDEIAHFLNVHPFRIQKTMEVTQNYSIKEIRSFLKNLAKLDFSMKSGKMMSSMAIELLILNQ